MISVLILNKLYDSSGCVNNQVMRELCEIYIPFLMGVLRYNGIKCRFIDVTEPIAEYSFNGKNRDNLIYVPNFSCDESSKTDISFIYTDSILPQSPSFGIASKLRTLREEKLKKVVFVNQLQGNNILKDCSPIIVDNMRFLNTENTCVLRENIFKNAVLTARAIAEYYGIIFLEPFWAVLVKFFLNYVTIGGIINVYNYAYFVER